MLYVTQLIYVKPGREAVFEQFEAIAIPLIAKHGGELMLRIRPTDEAYIAGTIGNPYEVHLVSFPTETELRTFMHDEERRQFLHLKEASITASILVKGHKL
jgi:uncharacterized protein (DUF1330 family)